MQTVRRFVRCPRCKALMWRRWFEEQDRPVKVRGVPRCGECRSSGASVPVGRRFILYWSDFNAVQIAMIARLQRHMSANCMTN